MKINLFTNNFDGFHFPDGKTTVMGDKAYENIHVVASILKMYLRLLPIPLITFDVHPLVLQALGT